MSCKESVPLFHTWIAQDRRCLLTLSSCCVVVFVLFSNVLLLSDTLRSSARRFQQLSTLVLGFQTCEFEVQTHDKCLRIGVGKLIIALVMKLFCCKAEYTDFRFESLNIGFRLICQCLIKDETLNTDILLFQSVTCNQRVYCIILTSFSSQ